MTLWGYVECQGETEDGIDMMTDTRHGQRKYAKYLSVVEICEKTHRVSKCENVTKQDDIQKQDKIGRENL